jgi:hypothetical protein
MAYDPTPEEIAKHYSACLDSVNVINDAIAKPEIVESDPTVIERNVVHLEGMRTAEFWTTEDMAPIDAAIAAGNAAMASGA